MVDFIKAYLYVQNVMAIRITACGSRVDYLWSCLSPIKVLLVVGGTRVLSVHVTKLAQASAEK